MADDDDEDDTQVTYRSSLPELKKDIEKYPLPTRNTRTNVPNSQNWIQTNQINSQISVHE